MDYSHLFAEASSPATDPMRLCDLAANYPELRSTILANPATYPELSQWILQQGSPATAAATTPSSAPRNAPRGRIIAITSVITAAVIAVAAVAAMFVTQWNKDSALTFLDYVDFASGDLVELAEFGSEVYVVLPYTNDQNLLSAAVKTRETAGQTALLDAAYAALVRAYSQPGQKAVMIFTDGEENASSRTLAEVVGLSEDTGIPVYLIGVGLDTDPYMLQSLADQTGGAYFSSPTAADLAGIYSEIYDEQKELYSVSFQAASQAPPVSSEVGLQLVDGTYSGSATKTFSPTVRDRLPLNLMYSRITASSTLAAQESELDPGEVFHYLPFHAFDGDRDTTWAEGSPGHGVGEWLQVDFTSPVMVKGFDIRNGYWRLEQRLHENSRVKRLRVDFSDGTSEEFTLVDPVLQNYGQLFRGNGERIEFAKTHVTSNVRFTVLEVYPGNRWEDVCITDISLFR